MIPLGIQELRRAGEISLVSPAEPQGAAGRGSPPSRSHSQGSSGCWDTGRRPTAPRLAASLVINSCSQQLLSGHTAHIARPVAGLSWLSRLQDMPYFCKDFSGLKCVYTVICFSF